MSLFGAATAAAVSQAQQQADTDTAARFVANAVGEWAGGVVNTRKIKAAVSNRKVLGAGTGTGTEKHELKRKQYARSPIINLILKHCMNTPAVVFVFQADQGMGKTTALFAIMGRHAKRGLAIFPGEKGDGNYQSIVLERLGIDSTKPPKGWLTKLVNELVAPWGEPPAVLMLDDFMNGGNGNNLTLDEAFLKNVKTVIRGKNIVVIVMTTNKKSANLMLTWNNMVSIIPAGPKEDIRRWTHEYDNFKKKNEVTNFVFDWNQNNRMVWETNALKDAVLSSAGMDGLPTAKKAAVEAQLDSELNSMDPDERNICNPERLRILSVGEEEYSDVLDSPRDGWNSSWNCGKFW